MVSFSQKLINISQVWRLPKIFAHTKNAVSFYSIVAIVGNMPKFVKQLHYDLCGIGSTLLL